MLNFCDFIQVYVFTTNHHLNADGTSGSFQMSDSKDFEMAPSTVFMCEILTFSTEIDIIGIMRDTFLFRVLRSVCKRFAGGLTSIEMPILMTFLWYHLAHAHNCEYNVLFKHIQLC